MTRCLIPIIDVLTYIGTRSRNHFVKISYFCVWHVELGLNKQKKGNVSLMVVTETLFNVMRPSMVIACDN